MVASKCRCLFCGEEPKLFTRADTTSCGFSYRFAKCRCGTWINSVAIVPTKTIEDVDDELISKWNKIMSPRKEKI